MRHASKPYGLINKALGYSRKRFGGQVEQLMFTDAVVFLKSFMSKPMDARVTAMMFWA